MIRGLLSVYQNESARRWFSSKVTENSTSPAVTWPILSDYLAESFEKNSLALGVGRNLERTSPSRVESRVDFGRVVFASNIWFSKLSRETRVHLPHGYRVAKKKGVRSIEFGNEFGKVSFYSARILIYVCRRIVNYVNSLMMVGHWVIIERHFQNGITYLSYLHKGD